MVSRDLVFVSFRRYLIFWHALLSCLGIFCLILSLSPPLFYWQGVANKLQLLKKNLGEELSALREIRQTVLQLTAPPQLVCAFY
jgi:hypothetical protein